METFNRSLKEKPLDAIGTIGLPTLIVAVYLALVSLGVLGFIRRSDAAAPPARDSSAALMCRCLPSQPSPPPKSTLRPAALRLGDIPVVDRL